MSNTDLIELKIKPVGPFYSSFDEAAFFEWLDKIKSVKKYEGRLRTLYITVSRSSTGEHELREFLALFSRYDMNLAQLSIFDRKEYASWFRNKKAPWFKAVFSKKSQSATTRRGQKK